MIGPAFISAPDSASPQGSIAPGNARPITSSAWSRVLEREHADRQPLGADGDGDLERPVLARQPGQGAGLGEAGVGAVAGIVRGLCKNHRAESRRRQEHDLSVAQMRRELVCDIALARRRGQDTGSARRRWTASAISAVTSASFASCRPLESLTMMREPSARCAATCAMSRRHSLTSWPCMAKSPAAANEPLPPPSTAIFKISLPAQARADIIAAA